jgi:hypothetical protein
LRKVERDNAFNRFEFDNDLILHNEVDALRAQRPTAVLDHDHTLTLEFQPLELQLDQHRIFVVALSEPWAKATMDFNRRTNDVGDDRLERVR